MDFSTTSDVPEEFPSMDVDINESDYFYLEMQEFETGHDQVQKAFTFIIAIVMLIFCLVGSFGNIMSILIFTRRSMRSSINVLLTGLSIIDLCVLVLTIPLFTIPGLNAYGHLGKMPTLQMAIVFGLYQIAIMAQTCSVWMFVVITVERYFAVCHPLRVQRLFTAKRAKIAQFVMLCLSILYNMSRFWEYTMVYDHQGHPYYKRWLRANGVYFLGYYTVSYLFIHFLIPFSLIAFLNWRITSAIEISNKLRMTMTLTNCRIDSSRQHQVTRMIAVVTVIFAICNVLPFALNIWEAIHPLSFTFSENGHEWHSFTAYLMLEVSNLLVVLNSSINFLVYLIYCQKYRAIFTYYLNGNVLVAGHEPLVTSDRLLTGDRIRMLRRSSTAGTNGSMILFPLHRVHGLSKPDSTSF